METNVLLNNTRRTILIVDDEEINRELLGYLFESQYNVLYAEDGVEALEILKEKQGMISIVLLDINMPRMTGIELLQIMREDGEMSQIPVVVLTSDKESELKTLQIGAMDFIKKPYDRPEIIIARVQRLIEFVEDKKIIRDVERDTLTNLYTGRIFYEYGALLMKRNPMEHYDVLVLNLDHFRMINELYGKVFGDRLLCVLADEIRETAEQNGGIACRSNADVFFVLMRHLENYEPVYRKLMGKLAEMRLKQNLRARIRMGVYPDVNLETHSLEWYADAAKSACNSVRSDYYSGIAVYDEDMHSRELYQERLIADMDQGIREKQFKVYFQPKYEVQNGEPRLTSAEALIRWVHPELGFISPGAFIPLFEKNGLIMKLDEYVFRETAAYIRQWRSQYGWAPPVSVNLSRMDFYDPHLKDWMVGIVKENGIDVKDMMVEVTESALSNEEDRMLNLIRELRDAGFMIEMDDFGSGYSSLNMLCIMPVDALKIDMKFVRNIVSSKNGYRIVELVVEMARALSVPTIVEGVEDADQYELVKQAGCDIVQGYYFARPMDADSYSVLLKENTKQEDL